MTMRHALFDGDYYHGSAPEPTSAVVDTATTQQYADEVSRLAADAADVAAAPSPLDEAAPKRRRASS